MVLYKYHILLLEVIVMHYNWPDNHYGLSLLLSYFASMGLATIQQPALSF